MLYGSIDLLRFHSAPKLYFMTCPSSPRRFVPGVVMLSASDSRGEVEKDNKLETINSIALISYKRHKNKFRQNRKT